MADGDTNSSTRTRLSVSCANLKVVIKSLPLRTVSRLLTCLDMETPVLICLGCMLLSVCLFTVLLREEFWFFFRLCLLAWPFWPEVVFRLLPVIFLVKIWLWSSNSTRRPNRDYSLVKYGLCVINLIIIDWQRFYLCNTVFPPNYLCFELLLKSRRPTRLECNSSTATR